MKTISFDSHANVKRLMSAGMSESQAEAVVGVIVDVRVWRRANPPMSDGDVVLSAPGADASSRAFSKEMRRMKTELICWIVGTNVVSTLGPWLIHKL